MTYPDASPTEIKAPVRTYLNTDTGSRVTFVGTHHIARPEYFTQIEQLIVELQEQGAHVYYEHVQNPTPQQLAEAPKDLREAVELMTTRFGSNRDRGAAMGLVYQADTLPFRQRGWEIHDVTKLQMAEAFGMTGKAMRQENLQNKIMAFANRGIPAAQRARSTLLGLAQNMAAVTGGVGTAVVLDTPSRLFAELRERLVLTALDNQLIETPGADFVLVWGAGHVVGFGKGLVERGYKVEDECWLTAVDLTEIPSLASDL